MERFIKGDIVVVPFPFTDLTKAKRRPALVLAVLDGDDLILCQITSQEIKDRYSIALLESDFEKGSLNKSSNVRPNRIFTADKHIILYRIGQLKRTKFLSIIEKFIEIIEK